MRISFSALEVFENCPKRYEFQVIEKIATPKTKEQVFGTSLHHTLKYFYNRLPILPTLDDLLDYFRLEWEQISAKVKFPDEKAKEIYLVEGKKILENFYKKNSGTLPIIVALETRFEAPIDDEKTEDPHILTGIVDRIDKIGEKQFEIIDYKTNRKMPSENNLSNNFQLSIYAIGFLKRWPNLTKIDDLRLSLYFLKHSEKLTTKISEEDIKKTKERILKNIAEIEKNYFPPIPNSLCNYCPFREICPMWSHLYKQNTPEEKEIKQLVNEYFVLKASNDQTDEKLAEIKTQINSFLEKKGLERVFGDTGFMVRTITTKQDFDYKEVEKLLKLKNLYDKTLSFDKKKFDALLPYLPGDLAKEFDKTKTKLKTTKILKAMPKLIEKMKKELE